MTFPDVIGVNCTVVIFKQKPSVYTQQERTIRIRHNIEMNSGFIQNTGNTSDLLNIKNILHICIWVTGFNVMQRSQTFIHSHKHWLTQKKNCHFMCNYSKKEITHKIDVPTEKMIKSFYFVFPTEGTMYCQITVQIKAEGRRRLSCSP